MRRCLVAAAVALLIWVPGAGAQGPDGSGSDRFLTVVARSCPAYTDITANRARNNIQESLEDLGANTPYRAGESINPAIEANNQPACTPIADWGFTLGTGYQSRAVSGPWGALSIVTAPYAGSPVTEPEVPLLDYAGRPTGSTIEGAVSVELTEAQAARADKASSLWIQGGTVTDPVLDAQFPDQYGFGALRCAIDNLNGDNVEWISYPSGTEHVFCYAYYVRPPPTSGTIVIRKEVGPEANADETFSFAGNISYNPGGLFNLTVKDGKPASAAFYRAAGQQWTVRELVPDGWDLTGLSCTSGDSTIAIDEKAATATIGLAAGDTVVCTYQDRPRPKPGQLFIRKLTRGGVGSFDFEATPVGGGKSRSTSATTTQEDVPADADPIKELKPGRYRIDEFLPEEKGGDWKLAEASCGAKKVKASKGSIEVLIKPGEGASCSFVNEFVPAGGLSITKETIDGEGTTGFVISRVGDPDVEYTQAATTKRPNDPVEATGDSTKNIELGKYEIQEIEPQSPDGEWTLSSVICNGEIQPAVQGLVKIRLTAEKPRAKCDFVNKFFPSGQPPEPPGPNPFPGGPDPDLVVKKSASPKSTLLGGRVTYTVSVKNRGSTTAEGVTLLDQPESNEALVSAPRPCHGRRLVSCAIGDMAPGARVGFKFRVKVKARPRGKQKNTAVVISNTPEKRTGDNRDHAGVRIARGPGACPSAASSARGGPLAQAAC